LIIGNIFWKKSEITCKVDSFSHIPRGKAHWVVSYASGTLKVGLILVDGLIKEKM
jgi:hypothetical protein